MSAIVKRTAIAIAVATIPLGPALSQDMSKNFFSALTTPDADSSETEGMLLQEIDKMIEEVSKMEGDIRRTGPVTIDEIDKTNRDARRLQSDIELRKLQYSEMTAKIEMLMSLENTRQQLIQQKMELENPVEETTTADTPEASDTNTSNAPQEDTIDSAANREQLMIPRLAEVIGAAGVFTARVVSPTGVAQEVEKGDILVNGFRVVDITTKGMTISGDQTGNKYFVAPSEASAPTTSGNTVSNAREVGASGMPNFF